MLLLEGCRAGGLASLCFCHVGVNLGSGFFMWFSFSGLFGIFSSSSRSYSGAVAKFDLAAGRSPDSG